MSAIEQAGAAFGKTIDDRFADLATKGDLARVEAKCDETQRLMLGLIDAFNANTQTMETALNEAGIPVRLKPAKSGWRYQNAGSSSARTQAQGPRSGRASVVPCSARPSQPSGWLSGSGGGAVSGSMGAKPSLP